MSKDASPRRWSFKRLFNYGIILFLFALFISHSAWTLIAKRRFDRTQASLRAAGEPMTPADLFTHSLPDGDNASLDYRQASELINMNSPDWKAFYDADDIDAFKLPLTAAETLIAQNAINDNKAALALVDAARDKQAGPWHDEFDPFFSANGMHLDRERALSNLLKLEILRATQAGDMQLAIARCQDAVLLADAAQQRPILIAHLVAAGMESNACTAIGEMSPSLTVTPANRPAVENLIARLLDERPARNGTQLAWQTERMVVVQTMQEFSMGQFAMPDGPYAPAATFSSRVVDYVFRPLMLGDASATAVHIAGIESAAKAGDLPAFKAQMPTAFRASINAHPMLHLTASILVPSFDRPVQADYRALAIRRLAATALAMRIYAADHTNQLPPDLSALVPNDLPAVPVDAVDGHPLRFAANPARIYSVGEDEVDDGGIPVDLKKPQLRSRGDDVIYLVRMPRPAHK